MRVIDARSGKDVLIGDRINYPGGEWVQLVDFKPAFFSAEVTWTASDGPPGERKSRLPVRFMHPSFPFQRIVFLQT